MKNLHLIFSMHFFRGVMKIIVKFCKRAILLFGTKVQLPLLFKLLSDISLKEISLKISSNGNLNYTVIFIYFFYYIGANTYISSTIKTHQQIRGKNLTGLFSQFIVGLWQYVLLDQTWGGNRVVNMRWEWPSFKLPTRSKGRRRRIGITWNIDQIVKIAANNFVIYYIYFLLRRVV